MSGETDLSRLLRMMTPVLHTEPYAYAVATNAIAIPHADVFAEIREDEGSTIVARYSVIEHAGMTGLDQWARITLQIHSSLNAVGLTAAFATALGKHGISANVVAGYHHDHIFVQWNRRHDALQALQELSNND